MAWDLVGDWQGTMSTDGLFHFPGLGASGGPPLTTNILFRITAQNEYQYENRAVGQYYGGYSSVSGQLHGSDTEIYDTIIGGMVDIRGQVELTFLYPPGSSSKPNPQCIYFIGHLSVTWPRGHISGSWTLMELADAQSGSIEYQVGTLSVSKVLPFPEFQLNEPVRKDLFLGG
jgi:hypothetical protein